MLDRDLATLYGVETTVLNQAVKRNPDRFPEDFMFQLSEDEYYTLRSQFVTSNKGGQRYLPYAFTEQEVAMLSGILNSRIAIQVNIQIMRIFVKMRRMIMEYKELVEKVEALETEQENQNEKITEIYNLIKNLLQPVVADRKPVGYKISGEGKRNDD